MTREEEIKQAAIDRFGNNGNESQYMLAKVQAFMVGAKWADKAMIEKILNFMYENFYNHTHVSGHICTDSFESLEQMEEELIKAMEE